jgi:Ca2+-binding RTX toxin-like protein
MIRLTNGTTRAALVALALFGALLVPLATGEAAGAAPVYCLGQIATIVGTNGNDALDGTAGADVIAGLDGNDVIRGFGGNDVLCGGEGTNIFDGGAGADTMTGGHGDDSFYGNDGQDQATYRDSNFPVVADLSLRSASGDGNDVFSAVEDLAGSNWADYVIGDAGNNRLTGLGGNDFISGNSGDDQILDGGTSPTELNQFIGGPGYDILYGGPTEDVANFGGSMLGVTVDLTAGTATGDGYGNDLLSGMDDVVGTLYNDTIRGDGGPNRLNGNGGDDKISGEGGDDVLLGGSDNDQLTGGPGADTASYELAYAAITANLGAGTATGEGTDTLSAVEGLIGGPGNDVLTGGPANDTIEGGPGNDTLDGAGGSDTAAFDSSTAKVTADLQTGKATGQGTDTLRGFENLRGGTQADVLRGDAGPNRLIGSYSDSLEGRLGNDTFVGAYSTEVTYASATGPVTVDAAARKATGAAGTDTFLWTPGTITGSNFSDRITCDLNDQYGCGAYGLKGDDVLTGTNHGDTFAGGPGNDRINGLGANDTDVVTYSNAAAAVVVNLSTGTATGEGTDTLVSIQGVLGSQFADRITGPKSQYCLLESQGGDDRIDASAASSCFINGGPGNDTITGSAGRDSIYPYTGRDVVDARAGDDEVTTYDPGDDLEGGAGVDLLDLRQFSAPIQLDLTVGTLQPGAALAATGFETVLGTAYNDTIRGAAVAEKIYGYFGDDTIIGRNGNDELHGDSGKDTIYGLLGDDTIEGGIYDDVLFGGGGTDTLDYHLASAQGVRVDLSHGNQSGYEGNDTIAEFENVIGSSGDDVLIGDTGPNVIDGLGGTDSCTGGGGADTLRNCP